MHHDISQYACFHFYSWVWHWDETLKVKTVEKWLGVAETVGPVMTFWILPISCIPIPRSTVILIQPHEFNDIHVTKLLTEYTNTVNLKIGDHTKFMVPDNLQHNSLTSSETLL